jgi:hypothetical protein
VSVVAVPRTIFYETLYRVRHMLLLLLDLIGLDHGTNERCWTEKQEQDRDTHNNTYIGQEQVAF